MVALITGITSQDGAYLSKYLLSKGYKVVGIVRSSQNLHLYNLKYLGIDDEVILEVCDLSDGIGLMRLYKKYLPNEIYNLAAQSSVGTSFEQPLSTLTFNITSVLNFLEIIRINEHKAKFIQPCSSEMYGGNLALPINEASIIMPTSPYAISKATNFWTVSNYRNAYSLFACSAILFNHESFLRSDNFFVKKIIKSAIRIKFRLQNELRVGNLDIKRDFGYAPEYVKALHLMLQSENPSDYVISSGKSYLLRDIVEFIFEKLGLDKKLIISDSSFFRPVEIPDIYGSSDKIKSELGWQYDFDFYEILAILIDEELVYFKSNE